MDQLLTQFRLITALLSTRYRDYFLFYLQAKEKLKLDQYLGI